VREQAKVVGHAVRAMYLFSAAADLAHELDDATLLDTCERLWDNLIHRRLYLTGGIGPSAFNEGFTEDYDLPDETAYAETCATIGLVLWNHRLLQFEGDGRYADVIERGLYNGFLSGVSLDGRHFFYENPLASAGQRHRAEWFNCPCCPPNVARVLASLGDYFYSTGPNDLWLHLFAGNTARLEVGGQAVAITQVTDYPWDGTVEVRLGLEAPGAFTLHLRVPGWCQAHSLTINGEGQAPRAAERGYLSITREWQPGDTVTYRMDMPLRATWAHPAVRQLQGRVALERGPIVYALEGVDFGGIRLDRLSVDPEQVGWAFRAEHRPDLLGGVTVITGTATRIDDRADGALYASTAPSRSEVDLLAVPYCVWDNRAPGEMRVWLRAEG
jgi:DUF1680 family protein